MTQSNPDTITQPQFFRIHINEPDTELVLGACDNATDFKGIMARVSHGGVLIAAGGYPFGVKSNDASYPGFKKAHTSLTVGVGAITTAALLARCAYMKSEMCLLSLATNTLAFGANMVGVVSAGMTAAAPKPEGNVSIYADSAVALASPLTCSLTGGIAGTLNGSIVASVNSIVSASLNGITASVNGAYAASMSASISQVVGDSAVSLSARYGTAKIEGKVVQLGKCSITPNGIADSGFLTGYQYGTQRVDVRADDWISMEVGSLPEKAADIPNKFVITPNYLHAGGDDTAMTLDNTVLVRAGKAVMRIAGDRIKLFVAKVSPGLAYTAIEQPASIAWNADHVASQTLEATIEKQTMGTLIAAAVGTAAAIPVAMKLAASEKSLVGKINIGTGTVGVGAAIGAASAVAVLTLVKKKMTSLAREAKRMAADGAYNVAFEAALGAAGKAAKTQSNLPPIPGSPPKIDIQADKIVISVGLSSITIKETGIDIKAPPGKEVKVNNQPVGGLIPNAVAVR